ncbi:MAG: AbrB/MazE/SpoVT family DNA-binding domain-containing protein [Acidobacteria bacterium]|nr:AbrB/MazE/SpoVT family DNA-binding domain-containing protein [Acidobacteriota bacterium]
MKTGTLTAKGQITIPKQVRERMGLNVGDRLIFRFDEEDRLVVEPEAPDRLGRIPGLLRHLAGSKAASIDEMDEAVGAYLKRKYSEAVEP